jgi:hypothetical protein
VELLIHNQCPDIELISPVYAGNGPICHLSPNWRVDINSTMQAGFNIHSSWKVPISILMYELKNTKQFNKDAISIEDETTCTRLVMIWEVNSSKEFCVVSCLIENDKGHIWDRNNLVKLAKWYKLYDI